MGADKYLNDKPSKPKGTPLPWDSLSPTYMYVAGGFVACLLVGAQLELLNFKACMIISCFFGILFIIKIGCEEIRKGFAGGHHYVPYPSGRGDHIEDDVEDARINQRDVLRLAPGIRLRNSYNSLSGH